MAAAEQTVTWAEALSAIGAILTPIIVVMIGFILSRQLKRIEDAQWRSQALISARLGYYREIAEPLNDLLCYFTFIGSWKERTPPEVVALKRTLDKTFHTLKPFFGSDVALAYDHFVSLCFQPFGEWGADALLRTSFRRRREAVPESWMPKWESMFTISSDGSIPDHELEAIKVAYNDLLFKLVGDVQLAPARPDYVSAPVVLNN